jgi:hypothetical protein
MLAPGRADAHDAILKAIEQVTAHGPRTPDMGGAASTTDVGKAGLGLTVCAPGRSAELPGVTNPVPLAGGGLDAAPFVANPWKVRHACY